MGWIDPSLDHDLLWIIFDDATRVCFVFANRYVRDQENLTVGRGIFQGDLFAAQRKAGELKKFDDFLAWLKG